MMAIDNYGTLHNTLASAQEANTAFDDEMRDFYLETVAEYKNYSSCFNKERISAELDDEGENISDFTEICFSFIEFLEAVNPDFFYNHGDDLIECLKIATGRDFIDRIGIMECLAAVGQEDSEIYNSL